jgi:FAD-dependent oxidoreductase domain-containing protein 1
VVKNIMLVRKALYDTVIIGGGAVGASIAYHLALKCPDHKIAVVERDLKYTKASCMLSAGGIRQQFNLPENILMSCYSANFLHNVHESLAIPGEDAPDIQFHEHGYLMLSNTPAGDKVLVQNNKNQHDCGADWLHVTDQAGLAAKYPWLNTEDLSTGCYSTKNEGYFDPWAYVNALKNKSKMMGVDFIEAEVLGGEVETDAASGGLALRSLQIRSGEDTAVESIKGNTFVNCAGAWSNGIVSMLDKTSPSHIRGLPVEARKRCIFMFQCQDEDRRPPAETPLTVMPDGAYFRPEGRGGRYIAGVSPLQDNDPHHSEDVALDHINHELFEEVIWPSIATYVPAFEGVKVASSWAGFYEYNTLDQNCIMGPHPDVKNFLLCTGFSGHGLQMSPAAGMSMAELVADGAFSSINLDNFSYGRIIEKEAYKEDAVI